MLTYIVEKGTAKVQLFGEATAFETSKYEVTDFPPKQGKKVRPMR
jgi:hypothetical protein